MTNKEPKPPKRAKPPCTFGVPEPPKPETRLTWEELARLTNIVQIDLRLLEDVNRDSHVLDAVIQERQALIAKLEVMRHEAFKTNRAK